jgi:hypothetical protein
MLQIDFTFHWRRIEIGIRMELTSSSYHQSPVCISL